LPPLLWLTPVSGWRAHKIIIAFSTAAIKRGEKSPQINAEKRKINSKVPEMQSA